MTPAVTASVLAYMAEAWTWAEFGEHAVEVWADSCPHVAEETGRAAARRLVKTEERPPSIARFLTECRLIDREQQARALPAPAGHTNKAEAAGLMRAVRVFWKSASADRPEHNHKNDDENCPRCSTSAAYVAEHAPQIARILREN